MWILAMLCGMVLGKLLIHGYLCGKLLRLKMFRDDQVPQKNILIVVSQVPFFSDDLQYNAHPAGHL
jgi:hypothetical protein